MEYPSAMRIVLLAATLVSLGCDRTSASAAGDISKTIVVYDNQSIDPNTAIWNPTGIPVDGFRHANVFVEFEQKAANEPPLSVGVGFGPWANGRAGTRNLYDFSGGARTAPQTALIDSAALRPTWISGAGIETWHGEQGIASYAIRTPIIGPYMWVYPLNNDNKPRRFTIVVYLTR
jgi:hypothetical protein